MQCFSKTNIVTAVAFLIVISFLSPNAYSQTSLKSAQEAFTKAQTAWEKGQWDTALRLCDETLKINKRFKDAWQLKGQIYWQMKDYKMVLKSYQEYLKIDPKSQLVWINLSATFFELERYKEMEESYERAKEINAKYAPLYQGIGVNYLKMGNFEKSNQAFATLEELGETNIYFAWTKRMLQIIDENHAPPKNWKTNEESYQIVLDLSDPTKAGYLVMLTSSIGTAFRFSGSSDNPFKYAPNFEVWNGAMIFDKKGEGLLTNGTQFRYRKISGDTLTIEEGVIKDWRLDLTSKKCFLLTQ